MRAGSVGLTAGHRPRMLGPMECRPGCAACCITPSIATPLPGMPHGKPAGVRCAQLTEAGLCLLFGKADRPAFCVSLKPHPSMCGADAAEAMRNLEELEEATRPPR